MAFKFGGGDFSGFAAGEERRNARRGARQQARQDFRGGRAPQAPPIGTAQGGGPGQTPGFQGADGGGSQFGGGFPSGGFGIPNFFGRPGGATAEDKQNVPGFDFSQKPQGSNAFGFRPGGVQQAGFGGGGGEPITNPGGGLITNPGGDAASFAAGRERFGGGFDGSQFAAGPERQAARRAARQAGRGGVGTASGGQPGGTPGFDSAFAGASGDGVQFGGGGGQTERPFNPRGGDFSGGGGFQPPGGPGNFDSADGGPGGGGGGGGGGDFSNVPAGPQRQAARRAARQQSRIQGRNPGSSNQSQGAGPQDANPTGNATLDALRQQAADRFQLGNFDLTDPATNREALGMFGKIIKAAGGDPKALRAEIGPVRFGDRMREFFGKDVGAQSGVIQIGNGQTLNSLRSLENFGAGPGGGGGGGSGGGGIDSAVGGPHGGSGPGFPGSPGPGGGGVGGGGGGGGGGAGFLGFFENQLRGLFEGGFGIDPEVLAAQRGSITSSSNRQQANAQRQLEAQLNASGALGGGRNVDLASQLSTSFGENLLNQLSNFDLASNQAQLQDRQAGFGAGNQFSATRVGQQLGLGQNRNQAQSIANQFQLGQGGLANQRFGLENQFTLGQGQLGLGQQQFGLAQNNQRFNQGLTDFLSKMGLLG